MLYEDAEVLSPMFTRSDSPHHFICRPGRSAVPYRFSIIYKTFLCPMTGLLARLVGHIKESDDVSLIVTPHKLGGHRCAQLLCFSIDVKLSTCTLTVRALEFRTFFPQKAEDNTVRGHLLTAMSISPLEFDRFHLGAPEPSDSGAVDEPGPSEVCTDVTFSLKALRVRGRDVLHMLTT